MRPADSSPSARARARVTTCSYTPSTNGRAMEKRAYQVERACPPARSIVILIGDRWRAHGYSDDLAEIPGRDSQGDSRRPEAEAGPESHRLPVRRSDRVRPGPLHEGDARLPAWHRHHDRARQGSGVNVVDSSGWLEYLAGGPNASFFAPALEKTGDLL